MDIIYLLKVLWRKKWIILAVSAISVAAAYYFTLSMPRQFRAVSQIATGFTTNDAIAVSEDQRFSSPRDMELNFSNLLTSMNSGIVTNVLSYKLIIHELKNPKTPFRTVSPELKFNPSQEEKDLALQIFEKKLEDQSALTTDEENSALLVKFLDAYGYSYNGIKGALKLFRVPNTDFIQVEYLSENPALSAFAVNAFSEEFLRYYAMSKSERSGESVSFFEELVKARKKELDEKNETLKTFKSSNSFLNIEVEGEAKLSQIADLEKDRDEINSKIYGLDLTIKRLKSDINRTGTPGGTNDNYIRLQQQVNSLNEQYISSGSNNQQLLDSLNILRSRLRAEAARLQSGESSKSKTSKADLAADLADAEIQLSIEESKLSSIENKLRSLQGRVSGFASKEGTIKDLERETDVAQTQYLDAVNRFNDAKNKLLVSAGAVRQVAKATPPPVPESSKKILIIGMAGFTTFIFAAFVIILVEVLDSSVKTPTQFDRLIRLPLAGFLVRISTKKLDYNTLFSEKTNNEELETFKHYIRKVRFEIESLKAQSLLITSARKDAGKTFTLFSLAFALSLVNKKVLIIDTNFKNNALTRWLTKSPDKTKLIERKTSADVKLIDSGKRKGVIEDEPEEENASALIMPTKYQNIFIIGNAGGFDSPEEILSGRDFGSLVNTMKENFDYILLEGAALNDYSDSKELVRYADYVIPVFSADSTIGQLDKETITYLKSLGKKMGGAILNNVDMKNLKL
jgi:uncharacterized protein involved in exopolysaccharide biosynthesis/Mrp family chromosome partitioning ATPase